MNDLLTRISYSVSAFLSGLSLVSLNHIALLVGMLLGLMTFIITWIYKHKTYKLQVKYAKLQSEIDIDKQNS